MRRESKIERKRDSERESESKRRRERQGRKGGVEEGERGVPLGYGAGWRAPQRGAHSFSFSPRFPPPSPSPPLPLLPLSPGVHIPRPLYPCQSQHQGVGQKTRLASGAGASRYARAERQGAPAYEHGARASTRAFGEGLPCARGRSWDWVGPVTPTQQTPPPTTPANPKSLHFSHGFLGYSEPDPG